MLRNLSPKLHRVGYALAQKPALNSPARLKHNLHKIRVSHFVNELPNLFPKL